MTKLKLFVAVSLTLMVVGTTIAGQLIAPGDFYVKPSTTYVLIPVQFCTQEGIGCMYIYQGTSLQVYRDFGTTGMPNIRPVGHH